VTEEGWPYGPIAFDVLRSRSIAGPADFAAAGWRAGLAGCTLGFSLLLHSCAEVHFFGLSRSSFFRLDLSSGHERTCFVSPVFSTHFLDNVDFLLD
jgi:hypothetical protein